MTIFLFYRPPLDFWFEVPIRLDIMRESTWALFKNHSVRVKRFLYVLRKALEIPIKNGADVMIQYLVHCILRTTFLFYVLYLLSNHGIGHSGMSGFQ